MSEATGFWDCPACGTENAWNNECCKQCNCPRFEERINDKVIDKLLRAYFELHPDIAHPNAESAVKSAKEKIKKFRKKK